MRIDVFRVGAVQTNCYLAYDEQTLEAFLVDPGDDAPRLLRAIGELGLSLRYILLTHGHFDHIWGVEELQKLSGARVYAYEGEKALCEDADLNVSERAGRPCTIKADFYVKDGEEITIEGITCRLIATPGHTAGSCCYYFEDAGILFSGDTLFCESVGRTDLPTGSMSALVRSVREKLLPLPDEVKVYPGHGESTTIGHEKKYNAFL